ncbi:MAG TPA: methyltransferase [Bryobacteraceae bacterium]|nr:methyltransferase [Bryobacteraceae bacterium]
MNPTGRLQTDPNRVTSLVTSFYGSATLFAAAELGVFAELAHLRKSSAVEIAATLKLDLRSTTLLLDACVALGLLEKDGGFYRNSLDAETYLVPGRPFDLSTLIRVSRQVYPLWTELPEFVRTGMPVDRGDDDKEKDSELLTAQLLSQHVRTLAIGRPVIRRLDLQGRKRLLEVGAGPGTYSVLISLEFPQLHCTILDRPEVIKIASALISQQGSSQHVSALAGDYLSAPFPPGNDVVLMFGFLHREAKEQIPVLIRRAAESLNPGGVLYVMEVMTDETHTMPSFSALYALNVALTRPTGHIFSHAELQGWMEQAGLRDFSVEMLPPPVPHWLAHAHKAL